MARKKKRGNPYSWQIGRLLEFAREELQESQLYEMYYERMDQKIPYRILSVMIFFLKEEYRCKPGSLVALYRSAHSQEGVYVVFEKRYEMYYVALQERGFL